MRSLPRSLLVELESNVAEGIMQFYSTPWLSPTDLGRNVRYFNLEGSPETTASLKVLTLLLGCNAPLPPTGRYNQGQPSPDA